MTKKDNEIFVLIRHFSDNDLNDCLFIGSWVECIGKLYIDMKSNQFSWTEKDGDCYHENAKVSYPFECERIDDCDSGYYWKQVITYKSAGGTKYTTTNVYEIYRYTKDEEVKEND